MIRRLAYLAIAALFLLGTTACSKKEEKRDVPDDLQMNGIQLEHSGLNGEQAA